MLRAAADGRVRDAVIGAGWINQEMTAELRTPAPPPSSPGTGVSWCGTPGS